MSLSWEGMLKREKPIGIGNEVWLWKLGDPRCPGMGAGRCLWGRPRVGGGGSGWRQLTVMGAGAWCLCVVQSSECAPIWAYSMCISMSSACVVRVWLCDTFSECTFGVICMI